jgi:hypothetical protein
MGGSKRVTEIIRQERNGHKTTTFPLKKKKKKIVTFLGRWGQDSHESLHSYQVSMLQYKQKNGERIECDCDFLDGNFKNFRRTKKFA